jgi:hypothetical protein
MIMPRWRGRSAFRPATCRAKWVDGEGSWEGENPEPAEDLKGGRGVEVNNFESPRAGNCGDDASAKCKQPFERPKNNFP